MESPEPQPTPAGADAAQDPSNVRRAALISLVVIAALGALLALLVVGAPPDEVAATEAPARSAAAWVGDAAADAGAAADQVSPEAAGEGGYAPRPEAPAEAAAEPEATPADGPEGAGEPEPSSEPVGNDVIVKRGKVKSGVPVIRSLTGLGLTAGDAQLLINALDGLFDFRRAKPGNEFEVHLDRRNRTPSYFRYAASLVDVYEVRRRNDELKGRKVRVPTQKQLRLLGGTIASSLYAALADLDAHPGLAGRVVDVLSTQVNFYKEQRPGDTFRLMVEEETLDDKFLGYGPVLALEYVGTRSGAKRFFHFGAGDELPTYYDEKGISVPRSVIQVPLHYTRISSPFGNRYHPVLKRKKMHNGVDFAAGGGTPVWACAAGEVTIVGPRGANGNLVAIDHGEGLSSYYAHLARFAAGIKPGVSVRQRQVIGYVGNTGRSTGPHLHFGLKKDGRFIDPLKYKIRPGRPVAPRYRAALQAVIKERGARLDATRIRPADKPLEQLPEAGEEVLGLEEDL